MVAAVGLEQRTYALIVGDDMDSSRKIEFEGLHPSSAMDFVQRELPEQEVQLFEDGRSLGKMKCTREGYWTILPQGSRPF